MIGGKLRHTVICQSPLYSTGATSQRIISGWTTNATICAWVHEEKSDETQDKTLPKSRNYYTVKMRYSPITHTDRLIWNGMVLDILGVSTDEKKRETTITAESDGKQIFFEFVGSGGITVGGVCQ